MFLEDYKIKNTREFPQLDKDTYQRFIINSNERKKLK